MPQADLRPLAPDPVLRPDGLPALEDWSLDPSVRHLNHGSFGAVPSATGAWQQALREEAERDPVAWFRHLLGTCGAGPVRHRRLAARTAGGDGAGPQRECGRHDRPVLAAAAHG